MRSLVDKNFLCRIYNCCAALAELCLHRLLLHSPQPLLNNNTCTVTADFTVLFLAFLFVLNPLVIYKFYTLLLNQYLAITLYLP